MQFSEGRRSPITCDKGRGRCAPWNRSGEHTSEVRRVKRLAELSQAPRPLISREFRNLLALFATDVQSPFRITNRRDKR